MLLDQAAVEPHDCAGPAVFDVTMFGSLSRPGEPRSHTRAFLTCDLSQCDDLLDDQ